MDDHVSSTTFNTDEEHDKLQSEFGTEKMSTLDGMEVHENNEAEAKHIGEEDDILDLTGGVQDAVKSEEDPPKETFPSGPEPQQATEPEAPQPSDSAAAELTEEQTKAEVTEDKIPEPETEEPTVKPTVKEDTVVQPDTEETVLKPETEDIFAKPEPPIEAPVIAEKEAPSPASAVSYEPVIPSSAPSQALPLSSSANLDAPSPQSQDNIKAMDDTSKDLFSSSKSSWYETNMLSSKADTEDDFMFDMKPSSASTNPFQGFAPIGESSSGTPLFGGSASDSRAGKMSESPTPDLVQYAHEGELQESSLSKQREDPLVDLVHKGSEAAMDLSDASKSLPAAPSQESEEPSASPSLPDILNLSPLNPDKEDSGSSEGSPDSERSPVLGPQNPTQSPLNPFNFDSKVLLLKEMAEETEARAAEKRKLEGAQTPEQTFGTFDLVKEAETTTKGKDLHSTMEVEEKDWMFSGKDSGKVVDRSEPLNQPPSPPSKNIAPEDSDSGSPVTDSLSPVLDAMAKNPASFQVEVGSEHEKESKLMLEREPKGLFGEEPEVAEEASEHEVSSEEFEFVERPPKGVIDEFLETLDSSKFAKAPERGTEHDLLADFGQEKLVADLEAKSQEESLSQRSYLFSSQSASVASPQKVKADLEKPEALFEDVKHKVPETSGLLPTPSPPPNTGEPEKTTPLHETEEDKTTTGTEKPQSPKLDRLPSLSTEAVVELLYWRDIKTTGVVFGAGLFLLLSLTVCSIVSVCSYIALALLSVTITFRIYKGILQAVQKSDEGHPFKLYLDQDVSLSEDVVHKYSDLALERLNTLIKELRRLFLVEDLVDSLKFAVGMWVLTYVGALFNGLTLLILGLIATFSCPVIYEKNQAQIDHYIALVSTQVKDIVGKVQAKVPGMKRKTE